MQLKKKGRKKLLLIPVAVSTGSHFELTYGEKVSSVCGFSNVCPTEKEKLTIYRYKEKYSVLGKHNYK